MQKRIEPIINDILYQLKKGVFHVFSANILNRMIAMLSNMMITRLLTTYDFGLYSYVLNIYSYLLMLSGLGLAAGAFQFGAENNGTGKEYTYFKYCLKTGLLIDIFLVGILIVIISFFGTSVSEANIYVQVYIPVLIIEYFYNILLTILRCKNRIPQYAKILNYNTIIMACGTCIGAVFGIWGIIIGRYISSIFTMLHVVFQTKIELKKMKRAGTLVKHKQKELWKFSLATGTSLALNTLLYVLDISMIAYLVQNLVQVAYYKVATMIPSSLAFIPISVITALLPQIVARQRDKKWLIRNIKKIIICLVIFNFTLCLVLIIMAPYVICFISGEQYLETVPYFRILVFGYFFSGSFRSICTNILAALRQVRINILISVVSCVFDILLNIWFIQQFGVIGAAFATFGVILIASLIAVIGLIHHINKMKD